MDRHWFLWTSMDSHGYPWICLDIHGYPGISMDSHGLAVDIHGYPWLAMDSHGYPWLWISMNINGYPWMWGHPGCERTRVLSCHRVKQIKMDINGFRWISMDIHEYSLISMDIHRDFTNSLGRRRRNWSTRRTGCSINGVQALQRSHRRTAGNGRAS